MLHNFIDTTSGGVYELWNLRFTVPMPQWFAEDDYLLQAQFDDGSVLDIASVRVRAESFLKSDRYSVTVSDALACVIDVSREPEDVEPVRQKIEFEPPKQVPQHTANATPASDCGTCGKNISW